MAGRQGVSATNSVETVTPDKSPSVDRPNGTDNVESDEREGDDGLPPEAPEDLASELRERATRTERDLAKSCVSKL